MGDDRHMALAGYAGAFKRQKWIVLAAVLITTASAMYFSSRHAPVYEASSQVLLNPNQQLTSGAGNSAADAQARFDATEAQVAQTLNVAKLALTNHPIPGVTPQSMLRMSSVSANAASNILTVTAQSPNQLTARAVANGLAVSFVAYSRQLDTAGIQKAIDALNSQIKLLTKQINAAKTANTIVAGQRAQLAGLVRKQQQLQQLALLQTGGAQVSELATGAHQVEPQPNRDAALGAILGLVIGLGIAFVREALDTRVRSAADISEALGLPLLARLPTPPRVLRANDQLALLSDEHQRIYGEGYRQLRVAVDFANLDGAAKTVMVTSAVAEEGKSTTVSNLAVAMARGGRRVALVDLDQRSPFVHRLFNVPGDVGITNVVLGQVELVDALIEIPLPAGSASAPRGLGVPIAAGHLEVLPVGTLPPDPAELLETEALGRVLGDLQDRADIVLIDAPPLLPVSDATTLSRNVGAIVVVVRAKTVTRAMLSELRRMLEMCSARTLGFAVTAAETEDGYGYGYGYGYGKASPAGASAPEPPPVSAPAPAPVPAQVAVADGASANGHSGNGVIPDRGDEIADSIPQNAPGDPLSADPIPVPADSLPADPQPTS